MSELRKYVLSDHDGNDGDYAYDDYITAYEQARKRNMAVVAYVYEFADSELIWTPDGSVTWPPPESMWAVEVGDEEHTYTYRAKSEDDAYQAYRENNPFYAPREDVHIYHVGES